MSTVWRDPRLLLQCQVYLEVFVQQVTTAPRAAVYPRPAQLALTKMRLEEKAKITAKHALLVRLTFIYTVEMPSPSLQMSSLFECLLPGWFQDLSGQKECNPCPPGFHCQYPSSSPTRGSSTGVSSPLPCPAGYICPRESPDSQPLPCPKGTYSPSHGLTTTGKKPRTFVKEDTKWDYLDSTDMGSKLCSVV